MCEPWLQDINVMIGRRIRRRRRIMQMTQATLAEHVGVRFQQIQKYECAANQLCAGRLYRIALALQVPVSYFFDADERSATVMVVDGVGYERIPA